jgi:hypothetical protein
MGLPSSFISQNLNTDPFHPAPRMTQSIGRNGLHSGSFNGSRPTILQTESEPSSEIDRELDALTHQVRQLQMQQEMLGRNSTDSTPNATIELRRLSYEQRNEQAKRINHTTSLGTQEHQNGNVGKVRKTLRHLQIDLMPNSSISYKLQILIDARAAAEYVVQGKHQSQAKSNSQLRKY